ncbi:MAG: hypothetical protein CMM56_04930 [Rhodospirillaceae bacterium]|nr:hypothetical protein [Rhodospirillaceae bacterium]
MTKTNHPRIWIGVVYVILLMLVIPWYWPAGDIRHYYGLPLWVISTLIILLITSGFTAWVFLSNTDNDID